VSCVQSFFFFFLFDFSPSPWAMQSSADAAGSDCFPSSAVGFSRPVDILPSALFRCFDGEDVGGAPFGLQSEIPGSSAYGVSADTCLLFAFSLVSLSDGSGTPPFKRTVPCLLFHSRALAETSCLRVFCPPSPDQATTFGASRSETVETPSAIAAVGPSLDLFSFLFF